MSKHGRTVAKNLPAKGCFGKNMGRYEERLAVRFRVRIVCRKP